MYPKEQSQIARRRSQIAKRSSQIAKLSSQITARKLHIEMRFGVATSRSL